MADHFVKFAHRYVLPYEAGLWVKQSLELIDMLAEKGLHADDAETTEDNLAFAMRKVREHGCTSGCDVEVNQFPGGNLGALRITAMVYGEYTMVAEVLQEMLNRFNLHTPLTFTWSESCDLPKSGEFGGGAVLITKEHLIWASANNWAEKVELAYTQNPETIDDMRHYSPETFLALLSLCREMLGPDAYLDRQWARDQLQKILHGTENDSH